MNLVIITSVIRKQINSGTKNPLGIFSSEERFTQTIRTIETIRQYIPQSYIVLLEGGKLLDDEKAHLRTCLDDIYETDINNYSKSPGEGMLIYRYLMSDKFQDIKGEIQTLSKISGRYYLTEKFNWSNFPHTKFIVKFVNKSWLGHPVYYTIYYCIPKNYIDYFINGLHQYILSREFSIGWPDIEHCFYRFDVILSGEKFSPEILGVAGRQAPNGQYIEI